ncbi:MAG: hypothetical protein IT290_03560, partial [Deltaproteobacteria bacterium]|nr:hypothetical protein [Deltaproteobacteria bacterium]
MSNAYVPGLLLERSTVVRRRRELPLPGRALVEQGTQVTAASPVLAAQLPGEIEIVRVADRLGFDAEDVVPLLTLKPGDPVSKGQVVCEKRYLFGLGSAVVHAPCDGTVEFFTTGNAHLGIRRSATELKLNAYISGKVVEVEPTKSVTIETTAALIQGIFGVGGERVGTLFPLLDVPPARPITTADVDKLPDDLSNRIIVGGASIDSAALAALAKRGAIALVTGSIRSATLTEYVGYEIGVSITGDEQVPMTLIVTEGFGLLPLSPRVFELLRELAGKTASVSGQTQVRAGAVRPEIVVPLDEAPMRSATPGGELQIGSRVRCVRTPYFGEIGEVSGLPLAPEKVDSGAVVRVARVR